MHDPGVGIPRPDSRVERTRVRDEQRPRQRCVLSERRIDGAAGARAPSARDVGRRQLHDRGSLHHDQWARP